ncbi:AAA family ATPase [Treponema brennaborense]|uniref:Transport-associated protein n=1 Tax=Treponema brennaborense (strain DSM 12168 / CIP 105900 / DD5/3) TaxID=906968 RepID=F4LKI3_TREBD|nr:cytidylate kinase-like family protein [Treponema brennaborense]AEE17539.1 transport-associated protein [Treponema brennaborense DSM 12168]
MAVITISRQVAALGDEIAAAVAEKMHYKFIDRKVIEQRIIDLGFPADKLKKYDEKKPGFFASLAKDRDEYLDYLQTAVLEAASEDNCILIGRGSFIILEDIPNLVSVRFVAKNAVRLERLMKEFSWDEKQAQQRINESDANRMGFHKSFFNLDNASPDHFHLVMNTGVLDIEAASSIITGLCAHIVTPQKEAEGKKKIAELLAAQRLVNALVFEHKLNINFLKAVICGDKVILQGVADSSALAEKATAIASTLMKGYTVESAISVVQDFKAYP